jgi:threonine dehydrogenase-like Zn-dependent dehydrogenase
MKTAVLKKEGGFRFCETSTPVPVEDEVLIRVRACGVCSSDTGAYRNGLGEEWILGHEVVGTVEKLGPSAAGVQAGDRVTGMIFKGYREYTTARASMLVPVPECLSDKEAILEPLVCLLSGLDRAQNEDVSRVAVLGTGYMGLSLIGLLAGRGIPYIAALDIKEDLWPLALEMGANTAARPDESLYESFDMVFEATGATAALELTEKLCRPYGTMVLVGYHPYQMELSIVDWQEKGLTIYNAFENRPDKVVHYMRQALKLAEDGFPAGKLITHAFAFEELTEAFENHCKKPAGYLKSYIHMG